MTVRMAPSQLFAKQELKKQQQEAEKKEVNCSGVHSK
jgi:hypothetical protein